MKKVISLMTSLTFFAIAARCQTSKGDSTGVIKVKEPEYNNVFFLLDAASDNLIELERQTLKVKAHSHGFGGAESDLNLEGQKSPVRFKTGQKLEFIVRVSSPQTDPRGYLLLYSLQSKKNNRRLVVTKAGYAGMNFRTVLEESSIAFNATKYGESSYKIRATQDLLPGEYLLLTRDARDGFAFGID